MSPLRFIIIPILALLLFSSAILSREDVFVKKDSLIILAEGTSILGTGMYADSANPFALFLAGFQALQKADTALAEDQNIIKLSLKPGELTYCAPFVFTSELIRSDRVQSGQASAVRLQVMSRASLKSLSDKIKKARTARDSQIQLSRLGDRLAGLAAAMNAWPNTRENCQAMINRLTAVKSVYDGIMDDTPANKVVNFSMAISYDPLDAAAYYLRAKAFAVLKKQADALADFSKALQLDTALSHAYFDRAAIFHSQKKDSAAMEDYAHAALLDTMNTSAFLNLGTLLLHYGGYEEAVTAFTRVIELDSSSTTAFFMRATAFDSLRQYTRSVTDYTSAIRLDVKNSAAYFNRGIDYTRLGKGYEQQAEFDFSHVLSQDPKNAQALFWRGYTYTALARYASAVTDLTAAIAGGVRSADVFFYRGLANMSQNKHAEAINDFSKTVELDAARPEAWYNRAYSYGSLGKWEEAARDLTQAIAANPQIAKSFFSRGYAFKMLKRNSEAIADLTRYIELAGNSEGLEDKAKKMIQELKYDFDIGKPSPEKVIQDKLEREKLLRHKE